MWSVQLFESRGAATRGVGEVRSSQETTMLKLTWKNLLGAACFDLENLKSNAQKVED